MTCKECQDLFSEYYDGYATNSGELEAHLSECAICASEYKQFALLFDEIRGLPQEENTPTGFLEHMLESVYNPYTHKTSQQGPKQGREKTAFRKFTPIAAAVAVLAASFIWVMSSINFGGEGAPVVPYIPIVAIDGYADWDPFQGIDPFEIIDFYDTPGPGARVMDGEIHLPFEPTYIDLDEPPATQSNNLPAMVVIIIVGFLGVAIFAISRTRKK